MDFLVEECGEGRWSRGEVTEAVTILEVSNFISINIGIRFIVGMNISIRDPIQTAKSSSS